MNIMLSKHQRHISSKYNIYYRHYNSTNKRASIICIHGMLSDSRLFDNFASVLAGKGVDVYAIDLPGYGLSDVKLKDTNFDDVLASIHDLITSINDKPFLLGFSLGSIYAAYYASRYNDISGLILASSLLHPIKSMLPDYAEAIYELYQKDPEGKENLLERIELEKYKYNYILNDPFCRKEYPLSYLIDIFMKATNNKVLEDIQVPVLILHGKHDRFTNIEQIKETYKLLASKHKKLEILDTDHWLFNTFFYNGNNDSKIINIIERWLEHVTRRNIINTIIFLKPFVFL